MTVSEQIKQIRKAHSLNTEELGRILGVSPRTIEAWEQGTRTPRKSTLKLIEIMNEQMRFKNLI